jgi:transcriptional antiterminator RfaH
LSTPLPVMQWYLIHTKPRQEQRALLNLAQQGYVCYLPTIAVERLRRGALTVLQEPLFSRYLFIELSSSQSGQSWAPIRSTQGVSRLVTFGSEPARVDEQLIEALRAQSAQLQETPARLFKAGDAVQIIDGPFAGLQAIYQITDGERRAMVLIELLGKASPLRVAPTSLRKLT